MLRWRPPKRRQFYRELEDSKSTSGAYLCLVGPITFVPLSWICKRQTAISHSSTEAEVISLDVALRMEGLPSLMLWETILDVFPFTTHNSARKGPSMKASSARGTLVFASLDFPNMYNKLLGDVDYVPCTMPLSSGLGECIVFEDNDAVIKACIKGRSPAMRLTCWQNS